MVSWLSLTKRSHLQTISVHDFISPQIFGQGWSLVPNDILAQLKPPLIPTLAMISSHSYDGCLRALSDEGTSLPDPTVDPLERPGRDKPTSLDLTTARRLKSGAMTLGRLPESSIRINIQDNFVFDRPNSLSTSSLDHLPSPAKLVRYLNKTNFPTTRLCLFAKFLTKNGIMKPKDDRSMVYKEIGLIRGD